MTAADKVENYDKNQKQEKMKVEKQL